MKYMRGIDHQFFIWTLIVPLYNKIIILVETVTSEVVAENKTVAAAVEFEESAATTEQK